MVDAPAALRAASVRVVTDSTAGLPAPVLARWGIAVVPLQVTVAAGTPDERAGAEQRDVRLAEVVAALARHQTVTTSQPSPAAFADAWGDDGSVVSIHLSSQLSGTTNAARLAARDSGASVDVLDAGTTGWALGFITLAAARAAAAGGSRAEVAAVAREAAQQTDSVFLLDSIDAMQRGGRLAGASALLGTALAVKPLLHVAGGALVPLERVRTSLRGLQRLEELAVERVDSGRAEVAVMHVAAADRAEALARRLDERLGDRLDDLEVDEVSPVVGAHVGPGCVGVAVHRL